jgi:hypothetical protein
MSPEFANALGSPEQMRVYLRRTSTAKLIEDIHNFATEIAPSKVCRLEVKTLRDEFAMAALAGFPLAEFEALESTAEAAYKLADAMMGARK